MLKWFIDLLVDEEGPVNKIRMKCLKPKSGSWPILDDTPKHLGDDLWDICLNDIVMGSVEVTPKGSTQFIVPDYENIVAYYVRLTKLKWRNYLKWRNELKWNELKWRNNLW